MQPFGVVAASPFEVAHTENELKELAKFLKSFSGETKVVMEYTGSYYEPIARFLHNEGIYVSVVNAILRQYRTKIVRVLRSQIFRQKMRLHSKQQIFEGLDVPKKIPLC